jgi:transcriptional regulator with XRE-family HTH domain
MQASWFGERLRELRAAAGLTQKALAERAGLTRETVAYLECGGNDPHWSTVVALCMALGITSDQFLKPPGAGTATSPRQARRRLMSPPEPQGQSDRSPLSLLDPPVS